MGVCEVIDPAPADIQWFPPDLLRIARLPITTKRRLLKQHAINLAIVDRTITREIGRSMPSMSSEEEVEAYIRELCRWISPQISIEPINPRETTLTVVTSPSTPGHQKNAMVRVSRALLPKVQFTEVSARCAINVGMHFGELVRRACIDAYWQIAYDETKLLNYYRVAWAGRLLQPYSYQQFYGLTFRALALHELILEDAILGLWRCSVDTWYPPRQPL